jgi:hypothetical protein
MSAEASSAKSTVNQQNARRHQTYQRGLVYSRPAPEKSGHLWIDGMPFY